MQMAWLTGRGEMLHARLSPGRCTEVGVRSRNWSCAQRCFAPGGAKHHTASPLTGVGPNRVAETASPPVAGHARPRSDVRLDGLFERGGLGAGDLTNLFVLLPELKCRHRTDALLGHELVGVRARVTDHLVEGGGAVLFAELLKLRRNDLAWPAPRCGVVDDNELLARSLECGLEVALRAEVFHLCHMPAGPPRDAGGRH
mmetsp:Transcript_17065/g.46121  ORF Transcript_17065/g.46121 Transcript_17065/m.46121 type:complete len:200 (-) Transcript_17065:167-766(-)